jgi:formylglycine-generating enzyme required for sulfatase activity
MTKIKLSLSVAIVAFLIAMTNTTMADIVRGINIDFVTIGNAGNLGDRRTEENPRGYGAVDYEYKIGKYEITNCQWDAFVSAAGEPITMTPWPNYGSAWAGANVPANRVDWHEAAQFCNYLTSGDKSRGAYLFSGNNVDPGNFLGINRSAAVSAYGTTYVIPTEDEWYKAAYYTGSNYSYYANGLDTIPIGDQGWNLWGGPYPSPWNAGTGLQEQNGTFDMMGNILEWNETLIETSRGVRGGAYDSHYYSDSSSACRGRLSPCFDLTNLGIRIAIIPEPSSLLLLSLGTAIFRRKHS